jgi:hypothetical protein
MTLSLSTLYKEAQLSSNYWNAVVHYVTSVTCFIKAFTHKLQKFGSRFIMLLCLVGGKTYCNVGLRYRDSSPTEEAILESRFYFHSLNTDFIFFY